MRVCQSGGTIYEEAAAELSPEEASEWLEEGAVYIGPGSLPMEVVGLPPEWRRVEGIVLAPLTGCDGPPQLSSRRALFYLALGSLGCLVAAHSLVDCH